MKNATTLERLSDRELVLTRTIHGPARLVFEVWSKAELFRQWWIPKSVPIKLLSCEMDVRTGGEYRLVFDAGEGKTMAFFGKYIEVIPPTRIVWSNDEGGADATYITTVTFEEKDGKTLVKLHERHPSKECLEEALGAAEGTRESLDQLEDFVTARATR